MGYRGKLAERERARELRAQGWIYADICAELGVSKASVSLWVSDVVVDESVRRPRRARVRGPNVLARRKQEEIERLLAEGKERIGQLTEREFLMAGVALYAGEGSKTDGMVRFTNSDPRMIAFFCAWFRHFFAPEEPRLRVRLYLHDGLDLEAATAFWAALTAIPAPQFTRPYRATPDEGIRAAKHQFGCAAVGYSSATTHRAVMGLVHALLAFEVPFRGSSIG